MGKGSSFTIIERPNVIDDHLLDIIGREFRFDHEKGLAEWMKNSVDAYLRTDTPDSEQFIILRLTDGKKDDAILECTDFVGMSDTDIEKAFIRWGDPEAAKRGLKRRVYGGHGNGGKFYMRQMFDQSHFITYRGGIINVFGFNENKKYGFADGYKNKKMKPQEAFQFAGLDKVLLPQNVKKNVLSGKTGFTVVRGIGPVNMKNKVKAARITDRLKSHPQARRLLLHKHVSIIHNDKFLYELLRPDEIKPMVGFEEPRLAEIPESLITERDGEKIVVQLANKKYAPGRLILRTSEEALQGGRLDDLNRVDFIGEVGESDKNVIASYKIYELGVRMFPQAAFVYGECICPILEDPENDCVTNDRTKLVENDSTRALLSWIRERIDELAGQIAEQEVKEQEQITQKMSSVYNDFLNQWKNKWMRKIFSDMFAGGSSDDGEGGRGGTFGKLEVPVTGFEFRFVAAKIPVDESSPLTLKASVPNPIPVGSMVTINCDNDFIEIEDKKFSIKADSVKLTEDGKEVAVVNVNVIGKKIGETAKITASTGKYKTEVVVTVVEKKTGDSEKKPKYPRVLLSGIDADPLNLDPRGTVILSPRQNLIYQRYEDFKEGIHWINTQSPLAVSIIDKHGVHSPRWRDYLFQRYVEIFIKEALYELQKKDPEAFKADRIDNDILGELVRKVHTAAAEDLAKFLFEEEFIVTTGDQSRPKL